MYSNRKSAINHGMIIRVLGSLLIIESFFLLLSLFVSFIYTETDYMSFGYTIIIALGLGIISRITTGKVDKRIGKREGFIIVSSIWVLFSIIGALPFIFSGNITNFTDAFFETISGFTTTGASILNDIESLPNSLLFWRSIIQWMGGMGIIVLSLAILPLLGIGGIQLFSAEVPGPVPDKLHPRFSETAKRLWGLYIIFTIIETILLMFGGMDWFDAINHSFTTMATGGYSTKQASVAYFTSPYIHYVITLFMFIAGTNFTLAYFGFKLQLKKIYKNEEFRYYFFITLIASLIIATVLYLKHDLSLEQSFRDATFQVVSIITTTGFATADYLTWYPFLVVLIFMVMFIGGSAGSTGGGIKVMRILILMKNSVAEFKRLIHPNAIIPVRYNHKSVPPSVVTNILAFIVIYMLVFVIGTLVMSAIGLDLESSMGSVIATLGNIGPGIGDVGPANNFHDIPTVGKWFLSFLMLVGRLELFTVLILFSPAFWQK